MKHRRDVRRIARRYLTVKLNRIKAAIPGIWTRVLGIPIED